MAWRQPDHTAAAQGGWSLLWLPAGADAQYLTCPMRVCSLVSLDVDAGGYVLKEWKLPQYVVPDLGGFKVGHQQGWQAGWV